MKRYNYAHERNEDHDENFQRIKRAPAKLTAAPCNGVGRESGRTGERHAARKAGQEHRRTKRSDAQFD